MLILSGHGSDPTELLYHDRVVQIGTASLAAILLAAIYVF